MGDPRPWVTIDLGLLWLNQYLPWLKFCLQRLNLGLQGLNVGLLWPVLGYPWPDLGLAWLNMVLQDPHLDLPRSDFDPHVLTWASCYLVLPSCGKTGLPWPDKGLLGTDLGYPLFT